MHAYGGRSKKELLTESESAHAFFTPEAFMLGTDSHASIFTEMLVPEENKRFRDGLSFFTRIAVEPPLCAVSLLQTMRCKVCDLSSLLGFRLFGFALGASVT